MIRLEQLDNRLVPTTINPAFWEAGAFESLGYVGSGPAGALRDGDLSYTLADWNGDRRPDLVVVGSAGGNGPVATVIDSMDGISTDDPRAKVPIAGRILERFAVQGFDEAQYRNGLDVLAVHTTSPNLIDGGWELFFRPLGAQDGPVVTRVTVGDSSSQRPAFVFGGDYRGSFTLEAWDVDTDGRAELIAMPGVNGAPRVVVFDTATMTPKASFYVGPESDRSGLYRITPGTIGVNVALPSPLQGFMLDTPDGPRVWGFDGVEYSNPRDNDPPEQRAGGW